MSYRLFLLLILLGTILSGVSWLLIIFYFDPDQIGLGGYLLFYLSLGLALSGLIFLVKNGLVAKLNQRQLAYLRVKNAIRHGLLLTALVIGWGILKSTHLLTWWNLILLIAILTLLEFFFISTGREQKRAVHYEPVDHELPETELNELNQAEAE